MAKKWFPLCWNMWWSDQPCCICLNSGTVQNSVEALLTDTRRKTAILMAALTKPCFNSNTNSSFSYSHKGTIFVGGWGHFRVYEKDFSFLFKFPKVENWNEISYASEFCILINYKYMYCRTSFPGMATMSHTKILRKSETQLMLFSNKYRIEI